MTNGIFFGSITVLLGTIVSLLSFVLLPFCKHMDGIVMRCHYTSITDGFVGIAIALVGIAYLLLPKAQKALSFAVIALGVITSLVPTVIVGVCSHPHMHCHSISSPVLQLVGIVIALFAVANIAFLASRNFESEDFTNETHYA
ncbi:DUF4418 family protein [Fibrobacter sp. UWB11]|uniref:DUF4418 family protein n=1 Tax=Fibrobacter sp. UWB11 TaxID=1896202 RepID=UPI000925AF8B|nr:DUF4418 family protein [Fibrobacter sp. UWB11]SIO39806.1 protein of unknown function [Fibrobacter sp. UWB11]